MLRAFIVATALALIGCGGGGSGGGATGGSGNGGSGSGNGGGNTGGDPPFGIDARPPVANFTLPNQTGGNGGVTLVSAFPSLPSFDRPLFLAPVPAPDTRLVVVEQTGRVRAFNPANATSTTL